MRQAILCGSFGGIAIDMGAMPTMKEIADRSKIENPKLYAELLRRGWIEADPIGESPGYVDTEAIGVYHPGAAGPTVVTELPLFLPAAQQVGSAPTSTRE